MPNDSYAAIAAELKEVEKGINDFLKEIRGVRTRISAARDAKEIEVIKKKLRG